MNKEKTMNVLYFFNLFVRSEDRLGNSTLYKHFVQLKFIKWIIVNIEWKTGIYPDGSVSDSPIRFYIFGREV